MLPLLVLPLWSALAAAQLLIEGLSFGHLERISPNGKTIPGWRLGGDGHTPEILNDRVILTPGYTGNTRGALWTETGGPEASWVAQLEFRVNGPENGGGNIQVWYAHDGTYAVGSSSVYTVGKFDGLAIIIDQYHGKGGTIRGFMNDGTIDYLIYHSVDSLAFGRCEYTYRNLGRSTRLQIKHNDNGLEVLVDDSLCFSTTKVALPKGYAFGVTAASAENPDSFEIHKFLLSTDPSSYQAPPFQHYQPQGVQSQIPQDTQASLYQSSEAQFEDLHNRLQALSHAVEQLVGEVGMLGDVLTSRHQEVMRGVMQTEKYSNLERKLVGIESTVRGFDSRFTHLQDSLKDSHSNLVESLPKQMTDVITTSGPRMGRLIFLFILVQVALVGAYQAYKRRIKQGPKKYL